MKYRCSFRKSPQTQLDVLNVEAADPYEAAVTAARGQRGTDFDTIEVWAGSDRLLTWLRPADEHAER
jgi:hypothetical protein